MDVYKPFLAKVVYYFFSQISHVARSGGSGPTAPRAAARGYRTPARRPRAPTYRIRAGGAGVGGRVSLAFLSASIYLPRPSLTPCCVPALQKLSRSSTKDH